MNINKQFVDGVWEPVGKNDISLNINDYYNMGVQEESQCNK